MVPILHLDPRQIPNVSLQLKHDWRGFLGGSVLSTVRSHYIISAFLLCVFLKACLACPPPPQQIFSVRKPGFVSQALFPSVP